MDDETRAYLDAMRASIASLEQRVEVTAHETRRHFDVTAEALRHDLQAVAEQVVANTEAIATLESGQRQLGDQFEVMRLTFADMRGEMNARFTAVDARFTLVDERFTAVDLAIGEVRREIVELRTRRPRRHAPRRRRR